MKNSAIITFLTSILLYPFFSSSQDIVKGGYRECSVIKYLYNKGSYDTNSRTIQKKILYDINGNMIREEDYDGKITYYDYYSYDSVGNCTEIYWMIATTHTWDEGIDYYTSVGENGKKIMKYNDLGKITEKDEYEYELYNAVYLRGTETWTYNNNGSIIQNEKNAYGEKFKIVYKYNEQGKNTEEVKYNSSDSVYKCFLEYNEEGKNISRKYTYFNPSYDMTYEYQYDDKGILSEYIKYLQTARYTEQKMYGCFDTSGYKIKEVEFDSVKYIAKQSKWEYNKDGKVTLELIEDGKGEFISMKSWTYDEFGNLLEEISYSDKNTPSSKITYKYSM
jgi:hypothetical protein